MVIKEINVKTVCFHKHTSISEALVITLIVYITHHFVSDGTYSGKVHMQDTEEINAKTVHIHNFGINTIKIAYFLYLRDIFVFRVC